MDEDELPGKKVRDNDPSQCVDLLTEPWIHPYIYGVSYNDDTGICNYTKEYCNEMEKGALLQKNYNGVEGTDTGYKTCETSEGQSNFGAVFGTTGAGYMVKHGFFSS